MAKLDLKFKKKPVFRFDDDNEVGIEVRKQEQVQRSRRHSRKNRKGMDDDSFIH